jgi:Tol biopolymer transport system component
MARDGYEADRNRLCIYNIATGEKSYVTESLDTPVDAFCWNGDSESLSFIAVWHGCVNIYQTNLKGEVK